MPSWIKCLCVFILMFISNGLADFGLNKNSDNYGPYTVEWNNTVTCRGPKSVNVSEYSIELIKEPNNNFRLIFNVTYPTNVHIDEIRLKVYTLKNGKKSILWNANINKPCQHYMMAAMLETYYGVKDCSMIKGPHVVDLPMTELMTKYFGSSFFYGDFLIKVEVNSKKGNLACLVFDPKFKKKTTH